MAKLNKGLSALSLILLTLFLSGCFRGSTSDKPPIHINPSMDDQPKYLAQSKSKFFANGSTMRMPVEGTVALDELHKNTEYYYGKDKEGQLVKKAPVKFTMKLLRRGQERFNIYCSPCHSKVGDGQGIVIKRGFIPAPTFHDDRLRNIEDGYIFNVITNGFRNMPSYAYQVPVADRWAIVGYLRALQRSQNASSQDVPPKELNRIN